jgi:hypothetical protein
VCTGYILQYFQFKIFQNQKVLLYNTNWAIYEIYSWKLHYNATSVVDKEGADNVPRGLVVLSPWSWVTVMDVTELVKLRMYFRKIIITPLPYSKCKSLVNKFSYAFVVAVQIFYMFISTNLRSDIYTYASISIASCTLHSSCSLAYMTRLQWDIHSIKH